MVGILRRDWLVDFIPVVGGFLSLDVPAVFDREYTGLDREQFILRR